ncbi:MAG: AAA domain-containing protein, partial [Pirellulaceae bacterium]|nr:AAA domain-containing protein [Pirellulaceae bacterium]
RAPQAIVVGDEMQLPPTDFFSARRNDDDEVSFFDDEAGEQVQYDLESNSLLNHAARNLSSTMLGWHYRSRSESLISFSNWAFYGGNLLTIPEEELPVEGRRALTIEAAEDAAKTAADVLRRPVSFHFLEQGVYEKRRNRAEATYIAHLVRAILQEEDHYSIGVVAFSEAQQGEIEDALNRLAQADDEFAGRLEQEYEREDDGEFAGLLVKNLENIQGDERDLIIMSVCYGHDSEGKMRMNFGPINKSGGEKRLNVAFSRARHRMVLVSSIRATDITNDYNDGANCLKRYLQYADATSLGDLDAAQRVLHEMSPAHTERDDTGQPELDAVTKSIGEELRNHGWTVDYHVGQSQFRCDLAMRAQGDSEYRLGVLVDSRNYYAAEDSLEREMMKPLLLRRFGWRVEVVLGKDWHGDREAVLERLLSALNADGGE